jgi:hypothetical protein
MTDSLACNGVTLRAFCYAGEHDGFAKSICSSQSSQKSRGRSLVACDNAGKVRAHRASPASTERPAVVLDDNGA